MRKGEMGNELFLSSRTPIRDLSRNVRKWEMGDGEWVRVASATFVRLSGAGSREQGALEVRCAALCCNRRSRALPA